MILDGRWKVTSDGEDADTPRRLYYVSMTRARETLTLVQLEDADHPDPRDELLAKNHGERARTLLQLLRNAPSVVDRQAPIPDISDQRLDETIIECTMANVVLSFAGWRSPESKAHRAIAALQPGDTLSLLHNDDHWTVFDTKGQQVGRMARKWSMPNGMRIAKAVVHGIFTRWASDESDEEHKQRLRSETWEVVVPQLMLAREPAAMERLRRS